MVVFWTIPAETLPRNVFAVTAGLVNAVGNLGGFVGPDIVGWLKDEYHSTAVPFGLLGVVMLINAGVALLLPKASRPAKTS